MVNIRSAKLNEYNYVVNLIKRNAKIKLMDHIELLTLPIYFILKRCFVYVEDNKIKGCVINGLLLNTIGYLFVDSEYRNKGIGSSLLEYAESKLEGKIMIYSNIDKTNYYLKRGYQFSKRPKMIKYL